MRVSRNLKESELKIFVKISRKYLKLLSLCYKSNPYLLTAPFLHFSSALLPADSFHVAPAPPNKTKKLKIFKKLKNVLKNLDKKNLKIHFFMVLFPIAKRT